MQVLQETHLGLWGEMIGQNTARATIYDESAAEVDAVIKIFESGSNGISGEVARWMLASVMALPVAEKAWLMLIDPYDAKARFPHLDIDTSTPVVAFVTCRLLSDGVKVRYTILPERLRPELQAWPDLYRTIALDEWLANRDGHALNLWRLEANRFALLDGAECFGGQYWTADSLGRIGFIYNKLAAFVGAMNDFIPQEPAREAIVNATIEHNPALMSTEQELLRWLSILSGADAAHAALEFLRSRIGLTNTHWTTQ